MLGLPFSVLFGELMPIILTFLCICIAESSTQYVVSLRAFNNFGKGPVVYDLIYTREIDGKSQIYIIN